MPDYQKLAQTAKRLIDKNGRSITISRLDRSPLDTSKPWRGEPSPRATGGVERSLTTIGVFVHPDGLRDQTMTRPFGFSAIDEELLKRFNQIVLVSGAGTSFQNLEEFDEVTDGSSSWKIELVVRLQPGDVNIMSALALAK